MNNKLSQELARKLSKDLCATPFTIGKEGLTHSDLLLEKHLRIVNDIDGKDVVTQAPLWYGEAQGYEGITCCLLTAPNQNPDELEISCVIGFKSRQGTFEKGSVVIGFSYDWGDEEDTGKYKIKAGGKWLMMTLAQKMQLGLGFEHLIQDGTLWESAKEPPEELLQNLSEIIEVD